MTQLKDFKKLKDKSNIPFKFFMHDITLPSYRAAVNSDLPDVLRVYKEQNTPMICLNERGRNLEPGVFISSTLLKRNDFKEPFLYSCSKLPMQNTLNFFQIDKKGLQHLFCFAFDLDEAEFLHVLVNKFEQFQKYLGEYWNVLGNEFSQSAQFFKASSLSSPNKHTLCNIQIIPHKITKQAVRISAQKFLCIKYLSKGLSFKEIAVEMKLSSRTVESYVYACNKVVGCRTTCELVAYFAKMGCL